MRITKRQLRRIIREACSLVDHAPEAPEISEPAVLQPVVSDVPSPEDYETVRNMLAQNPEMMETGISMVMDTAGTSCERSTAQAIIDHLQDMLHGVEEEAFPHTDDDIVDAVGDIMLSAT